MDNKNVDPVDSNDSIVVADESLGLDQEPSNDETTVQEEETSNKNASEATDSSEKPDGESKSEAEGDAKHSTGKLLNDMGETRKNLAGDLIALAQESDTAREMVKKRIEESPSLEKLFKTKFGEQYDAIMSGKKIEIPDQKVITEADLADIEEKARIRAKAELIEKEIEDKESKSLEAYALSQGFDTDELSELKKATSVLKGQYDFEDALQKAALIVNQDKVNAVKSGVVPTGGTSERPEQEDGFMKDLPPEAIKQYANSTGRKPQEVIDNLKDIKGRISEDGTVFHFE